MSTKRKCILKSSKNIYIASEHRFYNAKTITDEAATKFISQHPKNKEKFLVLPDGSEPTNAKAEKPAAKAEKAPEKAAEKKDEAKAEKPAEKAEKGSEKKEEKPAEKKEAEKKD